MERDRLSELSLKDFHIKLDSIEKIIDKDLENASRALAKLKKEYPFVREEEPYKKAYWEVIKKWHQKYLNADSHEQDITQAIINGEDSPDMESSYRSKLFNITPQEFKDKMESILLLSEDEIKEELKKLKEEYPYIREEKPYSNIYWSTIKKWSDDRQNRVETSKDDTPSSDIPNKKSLYKGYTSDTTFEGKNNTKNMRKIQNFGLFLEAKKEAAAPVSGEVQKEVKKIISEMFAYGKNIKFAGNQNGEPQYVEFEVDKNDFKMDYDQDLFMEYSENVLKKRKYRVALKYRSKKNTGTEDKPVYTMTFKINLKSTEGMVSEPKKEEMLAWGFEEKPTKVLNFIKGEKQKCKWDSSNNVLSMTKSAFDKCATEQLRNIIRDSGGEKVRI